MTKTEIKDRERYKRVNALKGLTGKQKVFVQNFSPTEPMTTQAVNAGYAVTTAKHHIYELIKSPRLQKAIRLYHGIGDEGLGELGIGTLVDVQTDPKSSEEGRINSAKICVQIAGKLKNINVNQNLNAHIEVNLETLASILSGSPNNPPNDTQPIVVSPDTPPS